MNNKSDLVPCEETYASQVFKVISEFIASYSSEAYEASMDTLVQKLGQASNVSRVYVFSRSDLNPEVEVSIRFEWHDTRVTSIKESEQYHRLKFNPLFDRWESLFLQKKPLSGLVKDFPESEGAFLKNMSVLSIIVVPIYVQDHLWGFIGFDECQQERQWTEAEFYALTTAANTIATVTSHDALLNSNREMIEKLQIEHSRLDTLLDTLPDLVWLKDNDGAYLSCNQRFESFFGAKQSEIIGKTDYDFVDQSIADQARYYDRKAMESDHVSITEETVLFAEDGHEELLETIKKVVKTKNGETFGVLGIGRDISQRKEYESRLQLFAQVFDSSHDGIIICDAELNVIDLNPAFLEISGQAAQAVLGAKPDILTTEKSVIEGEANIWSEVAEVGSWAGELEFNRGNDEVVILKTTVSVIHSDVHAQKFYFALFTDVTQQKFQQSLIEKQAYFDVLTGLPNRILLNEKLTQALAFSERHHSRLAVCFLDLDGFKPINDTYGHNVGDEVLIEVAERLTRVVRREDSVGRLGGDEFVLLLGEIKTLDELNTSLTRVLNALREPLQATGNNDVVSASIGVAFSGGDEKDEGLLLRQADQAMYIAKKQGRNQFHIFDDELDNFLQQQLVLQEEMTQALRSDQFELFYQPKVQLRDGEIVSFEALIRWNHPQKGLLQPASFLPFLNGQIQAFELDKWVLKTVFTQCQSWNQAGFDYKVSVNISAETLLSDKFFSFLQSLKSECDTKVFSMVELEVLETSSLEDLDKAKTVLEKCIDLGFSISLDDFGTGYSSLSYLRHLPISTLKIDQSFIKDIAFDPEDRTLVESMVSLTKSFSLRSIAEGVESKQTARLLKDIGCEIIQGYGISKPMPAFLVLPWMDYWIRNQNWLRV